MHDDLPDDANWDDLMYKNYVRQSIEQGLEDSKAGRTIQTKTSRRNSSRLNENYLDRESRKTT